VSCALDLPASRILLHKVVFAPLQTLEELFAIDCFARPHLKSSCTLSIGVAGPGSTGTLACVVFAIVMAAANCMLEDAAGFKGAQATPRGGSG